MVDLRVRQQHARDRRCADAVAARQRTQPSGGGALRTIRTTLIPAPRLGREDVDGRSTLAVPANVRPLITPAEPVASGRLRGWIRAEHLQLVLGIGDAVAILVGFYVVVSVASVIGRPAS